MSTIVHPSVPQTYSSAQQNTTVLNRFFTWAKGQEERRFMWLALAIGGHGCVLTPLTILLIVALTGMNLALFMTALFAMAIALIVNLAAMPTKITIPVLFVSVLVDLGVIAIAAGMALK
jgi:hypothetical protein